MFLHVSSYFFIFLHVSQYFFICFSCFFMFYLGALVLPLLRGPLPVPPGRSPFPSIFFIPAAASGPHSGEVFFAPQGRPRQGGAMALGDTAKEAINSAGWVVLVPPDWPSQLKILRGLLPRLEAFYLSASRRRGNDAADAMFLHETIGTHLTSGPSFRSACLAAQRTTTPSLHST